MAKETISFNIDIYNELTRVRETITVDSARIIDSPIDVIIGRPTIKKYKLLGKCEEQILSDTRDKNIGILAGLDNEVYVENDIWLQLHLLTESTDEGRYDEGIVDIHNDESTMDIHTVDDDESVQPNLATLHSRPTLLHRCRQTTGTDENSHGHGRQSSRVRTTILTGTDDIPHGHGRPL